MNVFTTEQLKKDPSGVVQHFPNLNLQLHCCRYWMLFEWECQNMSFPFWRLYYNTRGNASVFFDGEQTPLNAQHLILIPPYTSYSTYLKNPTHQFNKESILGRRILENDSNNLSDVKQECNHLFIHFNLGISYDAIKPGVYNFKPNVQQLSWLNNIMTFCIKDELNFDLKTFANIQHLLYELICQLPDHLWKQQQIDKRIKESILYIENHFSERISIEVLAKRANLVENSYSRLFKQQIGETVQYFIRKKRIEQVLSLLHHSDINIDAIATKCGFADRFHLSKVFKAHTGRSPANYRKLMII